MKVKVLMNDKDLMPVKAHPDDAGFDIRASEDTIVYSNSVRIVPTGMRLSLPKGYEAQIRPRSGMAAQYNITVLNTPGTIDCGYTGEVKVILINHGIYDYHIQRGDRIAQMVIQKLPEVELELADEIDDTSRGESGFGSTGR